MIKGFVPKDKGPNRPAIAFIKRSLHNHSHADLIGAEIGVLHAANSENILKHLHIKKLYCIDPYIAYPEYLDSTSPTLGRAEKIATKRLEPYKDKIQIIKKFSAEAKNDIPDDLDFVYIDANHSYGFAYQDIKNFWPKIRKGGVLSGHDYYDTLPTSIGPRGVKKAVNEFAEKNKLKVYSEGIDWWIIK